jgi:uncharacterized membrane protein
VLVFVFFMISDPQTAPKPPDARVLYGAAVAVVAAVLIALQHTEFGIKTSILSSLTVVCAVVPFIEAAARRRRGDQAVQRVAWSKVAAAVRRPAVAAALIIAVAAPVDTAVLSRNKQVVLIERGQVGKANAQ